MVMASSSPSFGKAFQRRLYSVLLDRSTVVAIIVLSGLLFISTLSFGEAWLEWSADKYAAVFNHFSDNIAGRSLQGRLCQYVPIDVVYTWVNGSDPSFLDDLKHAKEGLRDSESRVPVKGCPYEFCVASNMLVAEQLLPSHTRVDLVKEQNEHVRKVERIVDTRLACGNYVQNRSVLHFPSPDDAKESHNDTAELKVGFETFPLHLAHWTTDWTVPNSFPMPGFFMVTKLPLTATDVKVKHILPSEISSQIERVWIREDDRGHKVAVLKGSNATLTSDFVKATHEIDLGSGSTVSVVQANLIARLPKFADDAAMQSNRYADNDQLRYSIRSLEKFAPWVRKIFIVTNGQIPHWLDLDSKAIVVEHKEIFENPDDLPTFSSPAIEANIHKIEGLSDKFLYLNDDVMFGQPVWPEDFYSEHDGYKVRLSWPLPDCNAGCPSTWVKDGYCDRACNVSECLFDGGDCLGPNPKMGFGNQDDDHAFNWQNSDRPSDWDGGGGDMHDPCNYNCLDSWLADGFCDATCNVQECAFDAGDCGVNKYRKLHEVPFTYTSGQKMYNFSLPTGATIAFLNISQIFHRFEEVGLEDPLEHRSVRSVSISDANEVLTIIFHPDAGHAVLNATLQAKTNGSIVEHQIVITGNTTGHVPARPDYEDLVSTEAGHGLPREIELASGDENLNFTRVDETLLELSEDDKSHLDTLKRQLLDEEITEKGFHIKREKLLKSYVRRYVVNGGRLQDLVKQGDELLAVPPKEEPVDKSTNGTKISAEAVAPSNHTSAAPSRKILWSGQDSVGEAAAFIEENRSPTRRRLLDAYGDSLLTVNRLYSERYGHANRKIPSHMAHFLDKHIVADMQSMFPENWALTSRHSFRESDDMQFSFSYFHFVMDERKPFDIAEIFNEFDTDGSGTWSDREIRTLLTRMHNLPLYLETVRDFEAKIVNCSRHLPRDISEVPVPLYERYYDSKLPVVSKALVVRCPGIAAELKSHFKDRRRFKHEVVGDEEVSFKSLTSNVSDVVRALDDLRKAPTKFICINDDQDPNRESDNVIAHSVLMDFYESMLPVPSSFELPPQYRNKFTHVSELESYAFYRTVLRWLTALSFLGLVVMSVSALFNIDLGWYADAVFKTLCPWLCAKAGQRPSQYSSV